MAIGEVKLLPGRSALFQGKRYVILDIAGLDAVIAKDAESGKTERIAVDQLMPDVSTDKNAPRQDLTSVKEEDWIEAVELHLKLTHLAQ